MVIRLTEKHQRCGIFVEKKANRLIAVRDKNSIRAKITFRTELNSPSKLILQKQEKSFSEEKIALSLRNNIFTYKVLNNNILIG